MARPRPVFSVRCTSLPLGVGSAGLATLAFAAPPPKGREVQEDKGNLQKHFYTPPPYASPSEGAPALRRHRRVGLALRALHDLALQEVQAAILPAV